MEAATARLATFPPRFVGLQKELPRLLSVFDKLLVCVNEADGPPSFLRGDERITAVSPQENLKGAGKFFFPMLPNEVVYLIDDDIHYPGNYTTVMKHHLQRAGSRAIVGVHGVYCRATGGSAERTRVNRFAFAAPLYGAPPVIGAGTLCTYGMNLPPLDAMMAEGGVGVDALLARYCAIQGIALVSVPRRRNWLNSNGNSIASVWQTYTKHNPPGQAKAMRDAIDLRNGAVHRALLWRLNAARVFSPTFIRYIMEKIGRRIRETVRRLLTRMLCR
jgi:hypothetical protein